MAAAPALAGREEIGMFRSTAFGVMLVIVAGCTRPANEEVRRHACAQSMKEIGMALMGCQNELKGSFPERLSDLYPEYIKDTQIFARPGTRMSLAFRNSIRDKLITPEAIDAESDYEYVSGLDRESAGDTVILSCKVGNHPDGVHLLRVNGTVGFESKRIL
jgi:hypothetical protein